MISNNSLRLAGVIGSPIKHSLSPRLHNYWMKKMNIGGIYLPIPVHPNDLENSVKIFNKLGFWGFNVTLPYKERVYYLVDKLSPAAERMKAVNTVLIDQNGRTMGDNTDGYGFITNLRATILNWQPSERPVVLIGTGGATRAIVFSLIDNGARNFRFVNRTIARAEKLAEEVRRRTDLKIDIIDWSDRHASLIGASLCVNCTSLGMVRQPPLDLNLDQAPFDMIVADIVYTPLFTELLMKAQNRGHRIVDGLGMLIHQAVPGFLHWGGKEPRVDDETRKLMISV